MSTDNTMQHTSKKLRVHTILSALTLAMGAALMAYMIVVESEPGLLPLVLVIAGAGWCAVTRVRVRSHRKQPR